MLYIKSCLITSVFQETIFCFCLLELKMSSCNLFLSICTIRSIYHNVLSCEIVIGGTKLGYCYYLNPPKPSKIETLHKRLF